MNENENKWDHLWLLQGVWEALRGWIGETALTTFTDGFVLEFYNLKDDYICSVHCCEDIGVLKLHVMVDVVTDQQMYALQGVAHCRDIEIEELFQDDEEHDVSCN
jgi:hypothetical protein